MEVDIGSSDCPINTLLSNELFTLHFIQQNNITQHTEDAKNCIAIFWA
jgi:hypothetical protein